MKKIVLFLLLTANFIACKLNANFTDKKTEKEEFTITNSKKEISFDDLEEVSLPFCIKGSYVKDDLYYAPFATKKIQISDSITSILYAYIIEDGEPRVELQTFDKQGNYIDSIILYYRLADECSGERTFCIDKNFKIKIQTEFGCTAIEKDDEDFNFEQTDTFKITETGKIVKQ